MKKILVLLGLFCLVTGCSCNKEIYKFDSVTVNDKTYTCSKKDKEDASVKTMCDNFEGMSIELEDEDTAVINFPNYDMNDEEEEYKIENGYLYLEDDGEWMEFAKYEDDKIIIESPYATVVLKK